MGGTSIFFFAAGAAGDALAAASALVIGPGLPPVRAAAKMLAVSFTATGEVTVSFAAGFAATGLAADFSAAGLDAAGLAAAGALAAPGLARAAARISAMLMPLPPGGAFGPL